MLTTIRLKADYVQAIKENPELQGRIAQVTQRSVNAVWRWCNTNASQLTMLGVLITIREFLQLPPDAVITEHVQVEVSGQLAAA